MAGSSPTMGVHAAAVSPLAAASASSPASSSSSSASTKLSPSATTKASRGARATKGTSSTSAAAAVTDPVKRARRTAIERRSRQQRNARIQLLQDEVDSLTNVVDNLSLPRKIQDDARSLLHDFGLVPVHVAPPKSLVMKMDSLHKEMRMLEREHHQLQLTLHDHQNATAVMRDLLLQPAPDDWSMNIKRWDAISKQHYVPLTKAQCDEVMEDCMKTITRFGLSDDFVSSGLSLNGWVDKTRFEQSTGSMEFSFAKDLPHIDPRKQFEKYWNIFMNEVDYRRALLGLQCKYHMHILQKISDDVIIFRQDIKYPALPTTCHHISINFRIKTPAGYLVCMRTIPMPQVQQEMPDVIWTQNFHWNHADEIRDRQGKLIGTRSIACGSISSENAAYAALWVMEAAVTVLRVESALIAPLLKPQ